MRRKWMVLGGLLACVGAGGEVTVLAGGFVNPFLEIAERNPFALRPPPVVESEPVLPTKPVTPPATVEVTGIASILSKPCVLMEIIPGPGKPMLKPVLGVGERVDSIEVLSIDVAKAEVLIRNGGVVTNVALKVAKAGGPPPPPERGGPPGTEASLGNGTGIAQTGAAGLMDRRSVSVGGGVPIPERLTRIPRLPPAPQVNRPASSE